MKENKRKNFFSNEISSLNLPPLARVARSGRIVLAFDSLQDLVFESLAGLAFRSPQNGRLYHQQIWLSDIEQIWPSDL